MATFVREDTGNLTTILTLKLERQDYEPDVKKELATIRKKASIKGFRKGMAPISYLKKIYGNEILVTQINKLVNDKITSYISEEKLGVLGHPLPILEDMPPLDINKMADYAFKFELGLAPKIEVKGIDGDLELPRYKVTIEDGMIDEEVDKWLQHIGKQEEVEDVMDKDLLTIQLVELDNGEAKEGGVNHETKLAADLIGSPELAEKVHNAKKGDTLKINIWDLEDKPKEFIKKNVLALEEEAEVNDEFEMTILNISRVMPGLPSKAAFIEAFGPEAYAEHFGEEEKKEEDAEATEAPSAEEQEEVLTALRKTITTELEKGFENATLQIMFVDLHKKLKELNQFDLPKEFLKKWMTKSESSQGKDTVTEEEYETFSENLKWQLIRNEIAEKLDVQVSAEEVEQKIRADIRGYYRGYFPAEQEENLVKMIMEDQSHVEQRYQNMLTGKIFDALEDKVIQKTKEVSKSEFDELVENTKK